jgi:DNA modification methylase
MSSPDLTLLTGDCRALLPTLPAQSAQCVITSPPYWGLRAYTNDDPREIGREATYQAYVAALADVFDAVRRVLRDDGTFWLNLGDCYANDAKWGGATGAKHARGLHGTPVGRGKRATGLPPKSLVGIPWRVAFALQDRGWILRQEIIWSKANPMPESVQDRPTRSHETLFLFAKRPRYFYNAAAIAEPTVTADRAAPRGSRGAARPHGGRRKQDAVGNVRSTGFNERYADTRRQTDRAWAVFESAGLTDAHLNAMRACGITDTGKAQQTQAGYGANTDAAQRLAAEAKAALGGYYRELLSDDTRNARSVWTLATSGLPDAHYAVMPEALVARCILAGSRPGDTVLDPFAGSGTTGRVALALGRRPILIELNAAQYGPLIERRTNGVQMQLAALEDHDAPEPA